MLATSAPVLQGLQENAGGWEEEENPDLQVLLAWMANQVYQGSKEARDRPDPREKRVTKETLGQEALLTTTRLQVYTVIRFSLLRVIKARLDLPVPLVRRVHPGPGGRLGTPAKTDPEAPPESQVFQVVMVLRDHRDHQESQEKMENPAIQDSRVLRGQRGSRALQKKGSAAWTGCQD